MNRTIRHITIFLLLGIFIASCSTTGQKMPITTSSKKALENYNKGLELIDKFRTLEAVKYFDKAVSLDSNFAMAYLQKALISTNASDVEKNLEIASSKSVNASEAEKLFIDGIIANHLNNETKQYTDNLKKIISQYPKDERIINYLGNMYFANQEYNKAIEQYKLAMNINPNFSPVYNMLGYCYRYLQNYSEAEKMFKHYSELIPNDPNPYDSYAELLMKMGKFEESIKNYNKALEINPYFYFSYLGIASNLNYLDRHTEARNKLQELFRTAKNDDYKNSALNAMAISYVDEGNPEMAVEVIQKKYSIDLKQNNTNEILSDLNLIGFIYSENNQLDKALDYFNQANNFLDTCSLNESIKNNRKHIYSYRAALVLFQMGKEKEAYELAQKYYDYADQNENPAVDRARHQLTGLLAYYAEDWEKALVEMRQSNQQNPYNIYFIGLIHEKMGEHEKAKSYFEKAANANIVNSLSYSLIRKEALAKSLDPAA